MLDCSQSGGLALLFFLPFLALEGLAFRVRDERRLVACSFHPRQFRSRLAQALFRPSDLCSTRLSCCILRVSRLCDAPRCLVALGVLGAGVAINVHHRQSDVVPLAGSFVRYASRFKSFSAHSLPFVFRLCRRLRESCGVP